MNRTETDVLFERLAVLEQERKSWDETWKELAEYYLPYSGRFTGDKPNDGAKKGRQIYDGVAARAVRYLAAGMMGGLTSPARPWFKLVLSEDRDMDAPGVKEWLEQVERLMYMALGRSNFYVVVQQLYEELALFGNACLYVEEDFERYLRFSLFTAGTYCFALDDAGRVDTVMRRFQATLRQAAQAFGVKALDPRIVERLDTNPFERIEIMHCVQPTDDLGQDKLDRHGKPWRSIYAEVAGEQRILRHGGYEEMPYMTPRWSVTGDDVYGRSPALDALPDVKTMQLVRRDRLQAVQKAINPPLIVPAGYNLRLDVRAGAVNQGPSAGPQSIRPVYEVPPQIGAVVAETEDLRKGVREGLFNDLFLMLLEHPSMTATEVLERQQEKMLMLGPVVTRLGAELLDPLIDRCFGLLLRAGAFPEPPRVIAGKMVHVEYTSQFAQAQRKSSLDAISGAVRFAGSVADLDPSALDVVDLTAAVEKFGEIQGAPASMFRNAQEVKALRASKAEEAAKAQQAQQSLVAGKTMVDAAHTLSKADLSSDNALTRIMGALQKQGGAR